MSAGNHRHDGIPSDPELVETYREKAAPLIERAIIDRTHTVPWLANRTRDCKTVFIDRDVPVILPKCGVDTDKTLPWHEIPECLAMDDGLSYDEGTPSAHADVATPLERQAVEAQGASWQEYSDEMDGYIRAIDAEKLTDIPSDLDIRPFVDEGDRTIVQQVLAARTGAKTLYVSRQLENAHEFIDWAKAQGFPTVIDAPELHTTIAFSRAPVDWQTLTPDPERLVVRGGDRSIEKFGPERDVAVLRFESPDLADRWQEFQDAGASWDWPEYKPHVTISFSGADVGDIAAFDGALEFGPERFAEVKEDWKAGVAERSRSANVTKILHKLASGGIETLADKRQVVVAVSSANPDRVGDIVVQEGIDCGAFMRLGGTVLWQHMAECPIAKCLEIGVVNGQLVAKTQFPPAGISAKADEVLGLIGAGVINAASIGFSPVEWNHIDPKDPWGAQRFDKTELMEFSFVSVPANPDAAIMERSQDRAFLRTPQKKAGESWKCGASRNLPIGGDAAWDGPAAEKSIFAHCNFDGDDPDYAFARKAFLAYDSANPKLKGSYKLPFAHVVDGRLTAMPSGVRAAASRLPQADIPAEVQTKARAVLDHYEAKMKDGDKELTWDAVKAMLRERVDAAILAKLQALVEAEKAGRVLSEENMAHVQAIQKCFAKMMDCQTRALDSHGQTYEDLQQFVNHLNDGHEHADALMKSGKKPKKPPPSSDDSEDNTDEPNEDDSNTDDPEADVELAAAADRRKREIEILEAEGRLNS